MHVLFYLFFCYRRDPRKKPGVEPKVLNRRDPRRKNVDSSKQTLHLLPTPVPIAKRSLTPQPTPGILSLPLPSSVPDPFPDPSLSVGSNPTLPLLNRRDPRKRNNVEPAPVPAPSSKLQPISRLPSGLSSTASLSSIDSSSGVSRKDPRIRKMKTLPAPTVSTAEGPGEEQMMNIIKNPSRLSVPFKQTESPKSVSKTETEEIHPLVEKTENIFTKSLMDMDKDNTSPVYTTSFEELTISDKPGSDNSRYPAFMASAPPPPDSTPLAPVPAPPLASVPAPIPAPPPAPVRKISLEKRGDDSDSEGELQIDMNPLAGICTRNHIDMNPLAGI